MEKFVDDSRFIKKVVLDRDSIPSFEEYPFSIPVVRHLRTMDLHPKVTFFIGENGTGKSTLLEAIAIVAGLNPEGGSRNFRFSTRESHSRLCDYLRLAKGISRPKDWYYLRAESFFNVGTEIENLDKDPDAIGPPIISSYGGVSLHEQSHGESFLALILNRFRGNGVYLLDEPEAALSPIRQMSVLTAIHNLNRGNSQFIIATHSPILMAYPHSTIYQFSADGIEEVQFRDTEHYTVTKNFLNDPEKMLDILLTDD